MCPPLVGNLDFDASVAASKRFDQSRPVDAGASQNRSIVDSSQESKAASDDLMGLRRYVRTRRQRSGIRRVTKGHCDVPATESESDVCRTHAAYQRACDVRRRITPSCADHVQASSMNLGITTTTRNPATIEGPRAAHAGAVPSDQSPEDQWSPFMKESTSSGAVYPILIHFPSLKWI